jgi:hypothetical protein
MRVAAITARIATPVAISMIQNAEPVVATTTSNP